MIRVGCLSFDSTLCCVLFHQAALPSKLHRPPSSPLIPQRASPPPPSQSAFAALTRPEKQSFVDALMSDPLPLSLSTELLRKAEAQANNSQPAAVLAKGGGAHPRTSPLAPPGVNRINSSTSEPPTYVAHKTRGNAVDPMNNAKSHSYGSFTSSATTPPMPNGLSTMLTRARSNNGAPTLATVRERPTNSLNAPADHTSSNRASFSRRRASSVTQISPRGSLSSQKPPNGSSRLRNSRQSDSHLSPHFNSFTSLISHENVQPNQTDSFRHPTKCFTTARRQRAPPRGFPTPFVQSTLSKPREMPPTSSIPSPPTTIQQPQSMPPVTAPTGVSGSPSAPLSPLTVTSAPRKIGVTVHTSRTSSEGSRISSHSTNGPTKALPEPPCANGRAQSSAKPRTKTLLRLRRGKNSAPPIPALASMPAEFEGDANLTSEASSAAATATSIVPRPRRDARVLLRQRSSSIDITMVPHIAEGDIANPKPAFTAKSRRSRVCTFCDHSF